VSRQPSRCELAPPLLLGSLAVLAVLYCQANDAGDEVKLIGLQLSDCDLSTLIASGGLGIASGAIRAQARGSFLTVVSCLAELALSCDAPFRKQMRTCRAQ